MRLPALIAFLAILPLSACAQPGKPVPADDVPAGRYLLDPTHATILFKVNHLGFADFYGRFDRFSGEIDWAPSAPEQARLAVTVAADSVNTNVAALDEIMISDDFFAAETYPEMRFEASGITILDDRTGRLDGSLIMLDQTHPVSLDVTFSGGGVNTFTGQYTIGFSAEAVLDRTLWGLDDWTPLVGAEVTLIIAAEFVRGG